MTPKEKAIELCDKMYNSSFESTDYSAKKCALIAIDEILKFVGEYESLYQFRKGIASPDVAYWEQVKQEIEQL